MPGESRLVGGAQTPNAALLWGSTILQTQWIEECLNSLCFVCDSMSFEVPEFWNFPPFFT